MKPPASNHGNAQEKESSSYSLVTKKSLALALSPPRAPPLGTADRALLLGKKPSRIMINSETMPWVNHEDAATLDDPHCCRLCRLRQRALLLREQQRWQKRAQKHPDLLAAPPSGGDKFTRWLFGGIIPLSKQNAGRDLGWFRSIFDGLVTVVAPVTVTLGGAPRGTMQSFRNLTHSRQEWRYGPHPRQILDLYLPPNHHVMNNAAPAPTPAPPLIMFVHGGAWGSGAKWMYRLVAAPFLRRGYAVVIPGYRTYPDGNAQDQILDLQAAAAFLARNVPELCRIHSDTSSGDTGGSFTLIGHSSGAHIGMMYLVEQVKELLQQQRYQKAAERKNTKNTTAAAATAGMGMGSTTVMKIGKFIGLSGVYDISDHFDYEAARGVEEISPLKPANGWTRPAFDRHTPAVVLRDAMANYKGEEKAKKLCHGGGSSIGSLFPPCLLAHGIEDDTVPFTSTAEAARILRSCGVTNCQEVYLEPPTGHQDVVMQLMLGGNVQDTVLAWLAATATTPTTSPKMEKRRSDEPALSQQQLELLPRPTATITKTASSSDSPQLLVRSKL